MNTEFTEISFSEFCKAHPKRNNKLHTINKVSDDLITIQISEACSKKKVNLDENCIKFTFNRVKAKRKKADYVFLDELLPFPLARIKMFLLTKNNRVFYCGFWHIKEQNRKAWILEPDYALIIDY